jgi:methylated-DNA-protein-cysteine methyltransferase-like protein
VTDAPAGVMARRIRETVAAIPLGKVASYGQVAELAGWPRRARYVARVLGQTPAGTQLPWYRVVRADGRIAFAKDSPGYKKQRGRLQAEGVTVLAGRINMRRYRWQPDLSELLFQPPPEG